MNLKNLKNNLLRYWWIILLIIVILINIDVFEGYSDNYEEYSNPYIDDKNAKIVLPRLVVILTDVSDY